jgi:hypothetical protein
MFLNAFLGRAGGDPKIWKDGGRVLFTITNLHERAEEL